MPTPADPVLRIGALAIDGAAMTVTRSGAELSLTATEMRLRAKIEDDPTNPTLLRTVRGMGYCLVKA